MPKPSQLAYQHLENISRDALAIYLTKADILAYQRHG
jgi:hypothetical protein